jgi:hypothetical protein
LNDEEIPFCVPVHDGELPFCVPVHDVELPFCVPLNDEEISFPPPLNDDEIPFPAPINDEEIPCSLVTVAKEDSGLSLTLYSSLFSSNRTDIMSVADIVLPSEL